MGCVVLSAHAGVLRIHDIQGRGHVSAFVGQDVSDVEGVVTQLGADGFYMQDTVADDDAATSEGIRVSWAEAVVIGDVVRVSGTILEVRPGCAACSSASDAFNNLTTTEIGATLVAIVDRAVPLPDAVRLGSRLGERRPPSEIVEDDAVGDDPGKSPAGDDAAKSHPCGCSEAAPAGDVENGASTFDPERDGLDFYESLEGMRVEIDQASAVGPTTHPAGRRAQIAVVPSGGIGFGPFTSRGGLLRLPQDDNPERILVVGGEGAGIPDLDVGDAFTEPIVGVIDYAFGNFELIAPKPPLGLELGPPRPAQRLVPPAPDDLTVATFNVQNLGPASPAAKFEDIAGIIVHDLGAPDLLVLQEIQDNSGPVDDGTTDASDTYALLIERIAAGGGPLYGFRDVAPVDGQDGGEPGANIRVGFLVREDRGVVVVDRSSQGRGRANFVSDVAGVPELGQSPGLIEPDNDAFSESRKPVAIELRFGATPIFVVGVHFNSQLGDPPLFGRFQPPERPTRVQRSEQARIVSHFVQQILDVDPGAKVLVLGDMNDVDSSPPLSVLAAAGLWDLVADLPDKERYTHIFQGNAEAIDHVLVSRALADDRVDSRIAHANADFARASSDHDPIVARFSLRSTERTRGAGCRCDLSSKPSREGCFSMLAVVALFARHGRHRRRRSRKTGRHVAARVVEAVLLG